MGGCLIIIIVFVCGCKVSQKREREVTRWRQRMCAWFIEYMFGDDINARVDFIALYAGGAITEHSTNIIENICSHGRISPFVRSVIKKKLYNPQLDFYVRLSTACACTQKGVSTHATKAVEKRRLSVAACNDKTVITKKGRGKMIQKETLFGPVPFLIKEDTHKTIRKIKDVTFERCEKLVPKPLEIFSNPTVRALNFEECIKFMMYCVVFFQEKQGFNGYKLRGPVRD